MRSFCFQGLKSGAAPARDCTVLGRGTSSSGARRVALRRAALHHHSFTSNSAKKLLEQPLLLKSSLLFCDYKSRQEGRKCYHARTRTLPWAEHTTLTTTPLESSRYCVKNSFDSQSTLRRPEKHGRTQVISSFLPDSL